LIMPFKDTAVNRARSPMKLFEYAASGAMIVMPSFMDSYGLKNIIKYKDETDFLCCVSRALCCMPVAESVDIFNANSWTVKTKELLRFARQC